MEKKFSFEIEQVYQQEADSLLHARSKSKTIHKTGDIDASGDELEIPARDFFKRRLPSKYYVGHGHVVDKNLSVSPQIDIIIADNSATPILLEGQNGTQYFPYESIYLIGEIKSTYSKYKKHFTHFSEIIRKTKLDLKRAETPPNYIGHGISLGEGLDSGKKVKYQNPLFSFMLFGDSGDLDIDLLKSEIENVPIENMPNIIVFLDGKIIVKAEVKNLENGLLQLGGLEMNCHQFLKRKDIYWCKVEFTKEQKRNGHALALLMMAVFEHLRTCLLMDPPIKDHLQNIFSQAPHDGDVIDPEFFAKSYSMTKISDTFS